MEPLAVMGMILLHLRMDPKKITRGIQQLERSPRGPVNSLFRRDDFRLKPGAFDAAVEPTEDMKQSPAEEFLNREVPGGPFVNQ